MGYVMRKFIISDIHGFGNVYYSMINYLDNINKEEDIELYINGDLIDRGYESAEILLDIKRRIDENKFKIIYLGGNHELMMYEEYQNRQKEKRTCFNDWYNNGGYITDDGLEEKLNTDEEILEIVNFIANLKIYHKFEEKINNKNIVLCHAKCPSMVLDKCNMFIKDNNTEVFNCVWFRKGMHLFSGIKSSGNDNYFTIIGHTPNKSPLGYYYINKDNSLNIDGGCAAYVTGNFKYNHFPLVEIMDGYLKVLTFNSNNEIINGTYFVNKSAFSFTEEELINARKYLNKDTFVYDVDINEDNVLIYKNQKK